MKVALICCGRLENRYAVEFVEHYKRLGFDHIYICDNNHDGEEYFEDVLQNYVDENFVTIFNYRNKLYIQWNIYINIYNQITNKYDWIFCCDFDEFLTLIEDKNIKDYLSRECFKNYNQILINWKIYTDNDLVYDDGRPCLERFINPINHYENSMTKPIIRTKLLNIDMIYPHLYINDKLLLTTCNNYGKIIYITYNNFYYDNNIQLSYIKHFTTKTIDEWINNKMIRGTGDRDLKEFKNTYTINKFFDYNKITQEKLNYLKEHNINIDNLNL